MRFQKRFLLCLSATMFIFGSQFAIPQAREESSPGYHFIPASHFSQDAQSAAISVSIDGRPSPTYREGLQLVFETEVMNINNANITLKVNNLEPQKLLTRDGEEFGIGALDRGVMLTASYNGTDFRADFNPRPQFRYILPSALTLTGNHYSIADTSIPPVSAEPTLFGIKAEGTNTGDVTLSVNGPSKYPVFLSNGDQIPSGELKDGDFIFLIFRTTGGVGEFRAINLHPSRGLKRLPVLIATMPVPSGVYARYASPTYANSFLSPWTIAMGITGFTLMDIPISAFYGVKAIVTNGALITPALRITDSQTGWLFELHNGSTKVGEVIFSFSGQLSTPTLRASDNTDIGLLVWNVPEALIPNLPSTTFAFSPSKAFTVDANDDYKIKLYIQE